MKKTLLSLGLATVCAASAFARETLQLKLVPDCELVWKGASQEVVVKIDLSAITGKTKAHRAPLNLAVVLDKSGSISSAKLEKTKQAALLLVDRFALDDVFSLIVFSDHAEVLASAQKAANKDALREKIESIHADGSTALYAGVKKGTELNGGMVEVADDVAKIRFTEDREVAEKSLNGAVVAQKEIMLTAVAKDEAMAQTDAGNYKKEAGILVFAWLTVRSLHD